jgi:hypothetical protein
MVSEKVTIDKKLSIVVDFENYYNEVNALIQLRNGLLVLYNTIRPVEENIKSVHLNSSITSFGNDPFLPKDLNSLLPCYFHWFGNSLVNYCRLAGFIVSMENGCISKNDLLSNNGKTNIKKECDNYIKNIDEVKQVLKWRNKISAHFALTDPRAEDNISTLEASIIYPVGFDNGRYMTSVINFNRYEGESNMSSDIPRWSLTEVFELLQERYWTLKYN